MNRRMIRSLNKTIEVLTDSQSHIDHLDTGGLIRHIIPDYRVDSKHDVADYQLELIESETFSVNRYDSKLTVRGKLETIPKENIAHIISYLLQNPYQQEGMYYFHGAAIAKEANGVLLLGNSLAGKSTVSFTLAESGYSHLGDEAIIIGNISPKILAGNKYVAFDNKTVEDYPNIFRNMTLGSDKSSKGKSYGVINTIKQEPDLCAVTFLKLGGSKEIFSKLNTDWATIRLYEETSRIIRGVGYTVATKYPLDSLDTFDISKRRLEYCEHIAQKIPIYQLAGSLDFIVERIKYLNLGK
jgi:hypothetical protein